MSAQVRCRSVVFHRVHVHWSPIPTTLDCQSSSSVSLISWHYSWLLSFLLEEVQRCGFVLPRPCLPTAVVHTMSLCRSLLFLPGRLLVLLTTFMCASRCPLSLSSHLLTVSGLQSFFLWRPCTLPRLRSLGVLVGWFCHIVLVKLGGTPSHLRRCRLISRSNPSTVEVAISYSIRGHTFLGNRPC